MRRENQEYNPRSMLKFSISTVLVIATVFVSGTFGQVSEQHNIDIPADCSCIGLRHYSACEIGWKPDIAAVLVGKVITRDHQPLGEVDSVTLNVEEVFRGNPGATAVVHVYTHSCSPWVINDWVKEGNEYIVYAAKGTKGNDLHLATR